MLNFREMKAALTGKPRPRKQPGSPALSAESMETRAMLSNVAGDIATVDAKTDAIDHCVDEQPAETRNADERCETSTPAGNLIAVQPPTQAAVENTADSLARALLTDEQLLAERNAMERAIAEQQEALSQQAADSALQPRESVLAYGGSIERVEVEDKDKKKGGKTKPAKVEGAPEEKAIDGEPMDTAKEEMQKDEKDAGSEEATTEEGEAAEKAEQTWFDRARGRLQEILRSRREHMQQKQSAAAEKTETTEKSAVETAAEGQESAASDGAEGGAK